MAYKKKQRNRAKFSGRKQSVRGCIGLGVVILAWIGLMATIYFSFMKEGEAQLAIGSFGVLSMVCSLAGTIVEIISLSEEDIYKMVPIVGMILGIVSLVAWVGIYVMGILY